MPRWITVEGGGGLVALVAWHYGISRIEAARWLLRVVQPEPALARIADLEEQIAHAEDQRELQAPPPPEGLGQLSALGLAYLRHRGVDERLAIAYGILECHGGRYDRRIVFPAWGPAGELLYWQARATWAPSEDEQQGRRHVKAQNPPRAAGQLTSEHTIFNLWRAVEQGRGRIALCEGPISAIQAGDDAVAVWGKQLYTAQLALLVRAGVREVELMFDGPTEREPQGAWPEMFALAPWLRNFFQRVLLVRVPAGDPGDYTRAQNAAFRAAAIVAGRVSSVEVI